MDKIDVSILKAIQNSGCLGATRISAALGLSQLDVPARTVRFRLAQLDRSGLTVLRGRRQGRELTDQGRRALAVRPDVVLPCVPTSARVNGMVYRMLQQKTREFVLLDLGYIPAIHLSRALVEVHAALSAGLGIANRSAFVDPGKSTEWLTAPAESAALGMIGAATLDGLLLRQGVTVVSMGTGLMEIRERRPIGFVEWIGAESCCADVSSLFIAAGITRVRDVIRTGSGRIITEFREIPEAAYAHVTRLAAEWRKRGGGYVVAVGRPGESLCGLRVGGDRFGILAASGSNCLAAIRETGIEVAVNTCAAVHPREGLAMIESIRSQKWQRARGSYPA